MIRLSGRYKVYLLNNSELEGYSYIIADVNSPLDALVKFSLDRPHGYLSESTMTFIDSFGTWSVKRFNYETVA